MHRSIEWGARIVALIERLAARAAVPVFVAAGAEGAAARERLASQHGIEVVRSIREAALLIVIGKMRDEDRDDLRRLHDQMPHPRATIWWGSRPLDEFPDPVYIDLEMDPHERLEQIWRALVERNLDSEPDLLPNEPPNEWRGVGPHGQGGEGMMGGTPYGRPMAMLGEPAGDGMALDRYSARFGPFLDCLPNGLALELTLQGDVIEDARITRPAFPIDPDPARAALVALARMLDLVGLPWLGIRIRRCLSDSGPPAQLSRLRRLATLAGASRAIPPSLAVVTVDHAATMDTRDRFDALWQVAEDRAERFVSPSGINPPLEDLLRHLEWHEAMLVLASIHPHALATWSQAALERQMSESADDEREREHETHAHPAAHGGHGS